MRQRSQWLVWAAAAAAVAGCAVAATTITPARRDTGSLYEPHFADGAFFNPWEPFDFRFSRMLRFALTPNPFDKTRTPEVPRIENDGSQLSAPADPPRLTWVGHATVVIHEGSDVVVTDPVFSKRAFLFKRKSPPGLPLSAIPSDALAVISHNHNDHLDAATVEALPDTVTWFVPLGLGDWFRKRGRERVVELDWWQTAEHGRWRMTCLPSQHWSRRLDQWTNGSLWCAWLIQSPDHDYFFAGDTGYFHGFAEYGRRFPGIDVAMLPIGAYEPRWFMRYPHMSPSEAWQAFRELRAGRLLPIHWGTFDLAWEPLDQPIKELVAAAETAGGRASLIEMPIGGTCDVPSDAAHAADRTARSVQSGLGAEAGEVDQAARPAPKRR